jgi:co-chaperonin GroES (HSP10)
MPENRKQLIVVGDRVLVKPEEGEERSKVGLYLPSTAVDTQAVQGGRIVATGDYALFFRKAAVEITFEGERYLVVPQAAILALVREPDADDEDPPFD